MVTCCAGVPQHKPTTNADVVQELAAETVALVVPAENHPDKILPFCSGVWIGSHRFLTAGHCAQLMAHDEDGNDEDPIDAPIGYIVKDEVSGRFTYPKAWHLAKVICFDHAHDLAMLQAFGRLPRHETAGLARELPRPGDTLHFIGQDHGWYWTYFQGYMSGVWADLDDVDGLKGPWMQVSAAVSNGMSGSGAFDANGKLTGIFSFTYTAPDVAFFVHLDTVRGFVNACTAALDPE